jgi:hypothetical protein
LLRLDFKGVLEGDFPLADALAAMMRGDLGIVTALPLQGRRLRQTSRTLIEKECVR